ncbi:MAG: TetR family transcriptional regulator C-terminal domain-containing protein, partial [Halococcoides sp.]
IAEESSLTTAAVHYHFDTKADLLAAFLEWSIERFERRLADPDDPGARLATVLETAFAPPEAGDFAVAMMELKAQAPYEDRYREQFRRLDDLLNEFVREAVREGIDAGQFEACDPESVARLVVTLIEGGHVRGVALGEDSAATRAVVERVLDRRLGWRPEGSA